MSQFKNRDQISFQGSQPLSSFTASPEEELPAETIPITEPVYEKNENRLNLEKLPGIYYTYTKRLEEVEPRCFFQDIGKITHGKFTCENINLVNGFCIRHLRYLFNICPLNVAYDFCNDNYIMERREETDIRISYPLPKQLKYYQVFPIIDFQYQSNNPNKDDDRFPLLWINLNRDEKYRSDAAEIYACHQKLYKIYKYGSLGKIALDKERFECLLPHWQWLEFQGAMHAKKLRLGTSEEISPSVTIVQNNKNYFEEINKLSILAKSVILLFQSNTTITKIDDTQFVQSVPANFSIRDGYVVLDGTKAFFGTRKSRKNRNSEFIQSLGCPATMNIFRTDVESTLFNVVTEYTNNPMIINTGNCGAVFEKMKDVVVIN